MVILAVLYTFALAKSFFLPLVLALLLSLVLARPVRWLEKLKMPRALAAGLLVIGLSGVLSYGVFAFVEPLDSWLDKAPTVLNQIEHELRPVMKKVKQVGETASEVEKLASGSAAAAPSGGSGFREALYDNAQSLVTTTVMVVFLLYFFLAWGWLVVKRFAGNLRNRSLRGHFLDLSASLENDISRYLLIITIINIGLGAVVAFVLALFGMPNPILWGAIAALFNFVPYLGSLVTMVLLGAVAMLSFSGWLEPLLIMASFLFITTLEGQLITPEILGQRLALNPLVVFLSVAFWFWLWGAAGALMAVPILIVMKLIALRVESLQPLAAIIGR